jgi:hypothetical protein
MNRHRREREHELWTTGNCWLRIAASAHAEPGTAPCAARHWGRMRDDAVERTAVVATTPEAAR